MNDTITCLLLSLALSACAKVSTNSTGGIPVVNPGSLNGTWIQGCTSATGVNGLAPPGSLSFTSKIVVSNSTLSYLIQGFSGAGCQLMGNTLTDTFTILPLGSDTVIASAQDFNLTETGSQVCTPNCAPDSGVGTVFLGLYQLGNKTLSLNWASGARPTSVNFTFNLQ